MTRVMVMGTFDLFHKGHEYFLREARRRGDYLVVLIARDATVAKLKGKKPRRNEKQRQYDVKKSGIPDKVVLGKLGDKYSVLEKEKPDVICLGYDQTFFTDKLKDELKKRGIKAKIIRLKSFKPEIYKTSKIAKNYLYSPERK
ncbi:MAG: FAD synthase [Nanoarchaeota archaeon]|nr:MAG: FAD synthase [Nanoarchaeota archaeon]